MKTLAGIVGSLTLLLALVSYRAALAFALGAVGFLITWQVVEHLVRWMKQ